jgi:DNA-binding PadR family transcriptional regulator
MQIVKYGLLGLLAKEPHHGYELKSAFEDLLGDSWPLNIGQVYSTLARLERDRLVEAELVAQDALPDRKVYHITPAGRDDLTTWIDEPSEPPVRVRDELFLKVVLQMRLDGRDPGILISRQRARHLQSLADLPSARTAIDATTQLLVDAAMLHIEADLRWLDLCEERLGGTW